MALMALIALIALMALIAQIALIALIADLGVELVGVDTALCLRPQQVIKAAYVPARIIRKWREGLWRLPWP